MENSLNIPSSPSLLCFHILQTSHWPAHLFLHLASIWWRVGTMAKAVCGLSFLEVSICLSGYGPKQWPQGKHTWPVWKQSTAAQPQRCCPCRAEPEFGVLAALGCPTSAATCHLPRAVTQPPAAKIPDGTELCGVFSLFFFKYRSFIKALWATVWSSVSYSGLLKNQF